MQTLRLWRNWPIREKYSMRVSKLQGHHLKGQGVEAQAGSHQYETHRPQRIMAGVERVWYWSRNIPRFHDVAGFTRILGSRLIRDQCPTMILSSSMLVYTNPFTHTF